MGEVKEKGKEMTHRVSATETELLSCNVKNWR
jgi:hypothetical protein